MSIFAAAGFRPLDGVASHAEQASGWFIGARTLSLSTYHYAPPYHCDALLSRLVLYGCCARVTKLACCYMYYTRPHAAHGLS